MMSLRPASKRPSLPLPHPNSGPGTVPVAAAPNQAAEVSVGAVECSMAGGARGAAAASAARPFRELVTRQAQAADCRALTAARARGLMIRACEGRLGVEDAG